MDKKSDRVATKDRRMAEETVEGRVAGWMADDGSGSGIVVRCSEGGRVPTWMKDRQVRQSV